MVATMCMSMSTSPLQNIYKRKHISPHSFIDHSPSSQMPGLCMSRAAARVRTCVRSPLQHYKKGSSFITAEERSDLSCDISDLSLNKNIPETECCNRVMVVIDSNHEVLEWALSHTVQSQDTVILLHVSRKTNDEICQSAYDLLQATKNVCQLRTPGVNVEIAVHEGKDKGAIIVEAAKKLRASLLVLGQRKQSIIWNLHIWKRKRIQSRIVDYCIQNADCMTIAVRRRNRRYGGYVITTKYRKNFWLLA